MVQLVAFRQSLRVSALAVCTVALVAIATPASARPHHRAGHHHAHAHHGHRHFSRHHYRRHHGRHLSRASRWEAGAEGMNQQGFANANAAMTPEAGFSGGSFGASNVVAEARRYIGGNPTGRGRLWCARFMNMVLKRSGHAGTGSDMASSFAHYGHRISGPQVGAIAVMGRRGGGHVGVVSGIDAHGNPIVVSGNHNHRVGESVYPRGRIYAYVMPPS
ncbi:MAG: TIGR02594 family protein [Proteobacteria bacterium]|nr:TIGR02594 family protein [Pseudomonadota bacterium]